ncbi:FAS1 domain-containing protein [Podospora fimiseda]|uniref:FAS1 domain-containing protein n=1 Tax=Podospora fimiseda TaxID=252190 RepID=A0AAN7BXG3_9PEZI|nr:FAS1 domain-containing protein [Podospora fimiseda]
MLKRSLAILIALSVTPVISLDLLEALRANGLTDYARLVQGDFDIVNATGPGLIIYASTNEAIREANSANQSSGPQRRQDDDQEEKPTRAERKAGAGKPHNPTLNRRDTIISPGLALQTFLDDPELVNLGPGRNQTIVEKCLPNQQWPVVFSGLGANVSIVDNEIPFDGGVIRPICGIITIPESLSETLKVPFLNANTFLSTLNKTGLLSDIDNRAGITVLAPTDAALATIGNLSDSELTQVLKRHILTDVTAYTPVLRDGKSIPSLGGDQVMISLKSGSYFVNDATIVSGDVILKNGVLHTINKVLGPSAVPNPTQSATPIPTPTIIPGAAGPAKSLDWPVAMSVFVGVVMARMFGQM